MTVTIVPTPGFAPRIGLYVAQLEDVRRGTLRYASGLDPIALAWTPQPDVESIGTLLLHIAAVERSWIGEDIARVPMEEEWKFAFPIRFAMEQIKNEPLPFFLNRLDTVRAETHEILSGLSDEDLSRAINPLDSGDSAQSYSIEWILYHVMEHEAHHRGQIALMKRLYEVHHHRETQ